MNAPNADLNDVITSAVKARVEASVLEALSGDEFFGKFITNALAAPVEIPDPDRGYGKIRVPYVTYVLEETVRSAVMSATKRLVAEQAELIEEAVRKELRRSASDLAKQLVGSMSDAADRAYGIKVELQYPSRDR